MHVIYCVVAYTFVSRNSAFMLAFCSATWFYSKHCSTLKHGCTYLEEISVRRRSVLVFREKGHYTIFKERAI